MRLRRACGKAPQSRIHRPIECRLGHVLNTLGKYGATDQQHAEQR